MAIIEADFGDLKILANTYTAAGVLAPGQVAPVVKKSAFDLQAAAKTFAPVDTGFMRSNIQVKGVNGYTYDVTSQAGYSIFVEYGTSRMAAQPFMKPAAEYIEPRFEAALGAMVEQVVGL